MRIPKDGRAHKIKINQFIEKGYAFFMRKSENSIRKWKMIHN